MKIDDSILIRFINNDLSRSEKNKIQLLINNNSKIRSKVLGKGSAIIIGFDIKTIRHVFVFLFLF